MRCYHRSQCGLLLIRRAEEFIHLLRLVNLPAEEELERDESKLMDPRPVLQSVPIRYNIFSFGYTFLLLLVAFT